MVTAFTIQLSDVPRKLSDEVTENIFGPLTRSPPISRTTFIQNYYHALEHILLLYCVMVSNKSVVKEKDKPIYVLDKKTLDILPLP